jgi:hypothetical protein
MVAQLPQLTAAKDNNAFQQSDYCPWFSLRSQIEDVSLHPCTAAHIIQIYLSILHPCYRIVRDVYPWSNKAATGDNVNLSLPLMFVRHATSVHYQ